MSFPVVCSTAYVARHLTKLIPIDASWRLPVTPGSITSLSPKEIFDKVHLPNARFFDIDHICDQRTRLPHMLPPIGEFEEAMNQMGISESDSLIVYDQQGVFSSCRVYWTFKVFGHDRVSIMNGGLPKWIREGRPIIETDSTRFNRKIEPSLSSSSSPVDTGGPPKTIYKANYRPELVKSYEDIVETIRQYDQTGMAETLMLDARTRERFEGKVDEPRQGLPSGHMPYSENLPFGQLLQDDSFRPRKELTRLFEDFLMKTGQNNTSAQQQQLHGEDIRHRPIVTSCGSGITAAILLVALQWCGYQRVSLYDGSWAEYAQKAPKDKIVRGS
jgi:thiosulfate/3-mercaptopyruvate sulfurtransferase